jgi:hypothetical protein
MGTKLLSKLCITSICACSSLFAVSIDDSYLVESQGYFLNNLKVYNQSNWTDLDLSLVYEVQDNENINCSTSIKNYVFNFFNKLSDQKDSWSLINKNLFSSIIKDFKSILSLNSTMLFPPNEKYSYERFSIVYYDEIDNKVIEVFGYTRKNFAIKNNLFKSIDLSISWQFKEKISNDDYFSVELIDDQLTEFLKNKSLDFSNWEEMKVALEKHLMDQFKSIETIYIDISLID